MSARLKLMFENLPESARVALDEALMSIVEGQMLEIEVRIGPVFFTGMLEESRHHWPQNAVGQLGCPSVRPFLRSEYDLLLYGPTQRRPAKPSDFPAIAGEDLFVGDEMWLNADDGKMYGEPS